MAQLPKRQIQSAFAGGNSVRNTGNDRTKHWTSHDFVVSMTYQNGENGQKQSSLAGGGSLRNTGNNRTKHWTSHDFMVSMIYQNGEKG